MPVRNILLALATLVFAVSVSYFSQSASHDTSKAVPTPIENTAQLEKVGNPPTIASSSQKEPRKTTPIATSTDILPPSVKPVLKTPVETKKVTPPPPVVSETELNKTVGLVQSSVVNIICSSSDTSLRSISGTGVFISPKGLILTAAHIAQYFLLTDYPTKGGSACVIRVGSPAVSAYRAHLVYISHDWVFHNSKTLTEAAPRGTGEDDFAVLAITDVVNGSPMPMNHAYVPLSHITPETGDPVTLGSYGAEFLSGKQIRNQLYPIIDFGTVKEPLTFGTDTVDLLSLGGGAAAQEGSSGGGVLNSENELVGLITTTSSDNNIALRDLHAITLGHIRRSFYGDMGVSLDSYLASKDTADLVTAFVSKAAVLSDFLIQAITSHQ